MPATSTPKIAKEAVLATLTVRCLVFLLVTMLAVGLWMLTDMSAVDALKNPSGEVKVEASRTEFLLVLILLFLNVGMSYSMYRRFGLAGRKVRFSLGTIIASLLAICVWIGLRFLPCAVDLSCMKSCDAPVVRLEVIMAFVLILTSVLGMLVMLRRFSRAKPEILMSAYSKKVLVDGKWISIEEYLASELGIEVSHGMTTDERDLVMKDFNERSAREGIPHPSAEGDDSDR